MLKLKKQKRQVEHNLYTTKRAKQSALYDAERAEELKHKWLRVEYFRDYHEDRTLALNIRLCESMFGRRDIVDAMDWKKEILRETEFQLTNNFNFKDDRRYG